MRKEELHYYLFNTESGMTLLVDSELDPKDMPAATASLRYSEPTADHVAYLVKGAEGCDVSVRLPDPLCALAAARSAAVYHAAQRGCRQTDEAGRQYRDVTAAIEGFGCAIPVRVYRESVTEYYAEAELEGSRDPRGCALRLCGTTAAGEELCCSVPVSEKDMSGRIMVEKRSYAMVSMNDTPVWQERTAMLIGDEGVSALRNASVLVCGCGGVGGYVIEALARAGVGRIGVCDFDSFDVTNLNRQILCLRSDVGRMKTDVAMRHIKAIDPDCEVVIYDFQLVGEYTSEHLELDSWDYVADAIDDVQAKVGLIVSCREKGVPVISSMGAGNRLDPTSFKTADISKTHNDPLARSVRKQLRERGIESGVKVVFSDEPPVKKGEKPVPSRSYMPAAAGLVMASEIIRDIIKG